MSVAMGMFAVAGCALVATLLTDALWGVVLGLRAHVLPRLHFFAVDLKERYGSWAVVTGSTDGIGRAYAMELAKRGINIVLISRTHEKLVKIATQIESMYGVKTKTIAIDYSKGQFVFDTIEKELKDIPVGILVNNVGKQYSYPMYLTEVPEQELWDIVNINIGAATLMTRLILPQMKLRGRGAIVNVSSSSELQPLPLMTVYAASKVYLKSFSEALRSEYQGCGITIQHLSPLFINTKMNAFSYRLQTSSIFVPDAETYAQNAINTLGIINHSTGYWAHGIQEKNRNAGHDIHTLLSERNTGGRQALSLIDKARFYFRRYFFTMIPPQWVRTYIGNHMNKVFRKDYLSTRSTTLPVL